MLGEVFMDLAERRRKGDHEGIRFLTSIGREQERHLLETFLGLGFQIRHMENPPSVSFSIVGDELGDTVVIGLWHDLVVSNEPSYVRHFRSIFEDLWGGGVDAGRRMGELHSQSGFYDGRDDRQLRSNHQADNRPAFSERSPGIHDALLLPTRFEGLSRRVSLRPSTAL